MTKYVKLAPVPFGFAFGLISGIGWMLLCWAGARWGFGLTIIHVMGSAYYNVTPTFVGGLWALFDGFVNSLVFGIFVAIVYNCSCCWFCAKSECDSGACK